MLPYIQQVIMPSKADPNSSANADEYQSTSWNKYMPPYN